MMQPDPREQGSVTAAPPAGKQRARPVLGVEDVILAQAWKPLHRVRIRRDVDRSSKETASSRLTPAPMHPPRVLEHE
jgi:hypothetical protein